MRNIFILTALIFIAGCATQAPVYVNGKYYLAGDSKCVSYTPTENDQIHCSDSKGEYFTYRDALTPQDIQMYQWNQQYQQVQMQQLNQSVQQAGQSWQNAGQQIQQVPQYQAPTVAPINNPNGNQVRCINSGIYTNCRY